MSLSTVDLDFQVVVLFIPESWCFQKEVVQFFKDDK